MANIQTGYGHGDVVGVPFDFYSSPVASQVITMQTAVIVFDVVNAVSITLTLPLNPVDGAVAEVTNRVGSANTLTFTGNLAANTGDSILGTALASLATGVSARYRYSLNGDITKGVNPRTWVRTF